jgi:acyl carrier protein/GNAT superfamily N-acetyltransferase
MNALKIEAEVTSTLRDDVLGGSDRELDPSVPMGELGLGLDSLALVEFVTALENQYGIQFPEEFWVERGQLTLKHFIDVIVESSLAPQAPSRATKAAAAPDLQVNGKPQTKVEAVASVIAEEGWLRGLYWTFRKLLGRIYRVEQKRFILAFDITANNIPVNVPDIDVEFRIADINDEKLLSKIEVVQHDKVMSTKLFRERLDSGFICLVACHNEQIIGVDWISDRGHEEYVTNGLEFEMEAESCYALELYEDKRFMGKGVGLALLSYSLAVCKERGYTRQITWVAADNAHMLISSVQLLGARKIGEFQVRRIFNRPYPRWTIEGKEGRGNIVRI